MASAWRIIRESLMFTRYVFQELQPIVGVLSSVAADVVRTHNAAVARDMSRCVMMWEMNAI